MQLNRITHIKQLEQKMRDRLKNIDRTDRESSPNKKDKERERVRKYEKKRRERRDIHRDRTMLRNGIR